ncbi:ubiquitin carboxyl-terminal hydrolase CYLD isoform X2 [Clupea harengus]|uniref:ubiquitinyl hydrolase 1 n=1 Tax=Clupea harengus TaxID=7950 RepID=A0A6P8GNX9_CLUHA|nr:ubiquitin carboxyl-terminal hydrolase CYLD isoform X2 [Clupea harengus]
MSGVARHQSSRRRRPPKMFLVASDLKIQDHLDGTIRVLRGYLCQEQETLERNGKVEQLWVKVLDNGWMVKIERHVLMEIPADQAGLLEPVTEPEARLKLHNKPHRLQRLAVLPLGSPVTVVMSHGGLAEAELRYRGPLTRGSSAVYFGVQLKGWAAGKGTSTGTYKGHQLFTCPEACALFVPASQLTLRRFSRETDAAERQPSNTSAPHNPPSAQPPTSHQTDSPVGSWDGTYKNHTLCSISSPQFGHLLPLSKVTPVESRPQKSPPPVVNPKSALKPPSLPPPKTALVPVLPPYPKPALKPVNAPKPISPTHPAVPATVPSPPLYHAKVALQPPPKPSTSPPSLPSVTSKPPPPPPANLKPSIKPPLPSTPFYPSTDQARGSNGLPGPPSPPPLLEEVEYEYEYEAGAGMELEVGSMVEVNEPPQYGVIRWIGRIGSIPELVAGVELDQEITAGTDGSYLGERYFRCPSNKGLFVKLRSCRRDSRFPAPETPINQVERCNSIAFAEWGSERVEEHTPPLLGLEAREHYHGWKKGIQGHLNSCYLDATLFSLFSCCSSADSVLFCPPGPQDGPRSRAAQDLLRCEIVNPLRRYGYVCASKTMALRKLLKAETTDAGFTNQEKDPEEFFNKLFQLLRVEPLLRIRSMNHQPQECHLYQLFPPSTAPSLSSPPALSPSLSLAPLSPIPLSPPADHMRVASVQALLEASFIHSGLKFAEAPSCLPLLMPRFGKDFKMFDAILPSLTLDITDLLDETLRQCSICQSLAHWECLQCYEDQDITPGRLKQFCHTCNTQVHTHKKRASHHPERVRTPDCPWAEQWEGSLGGSRQQLELFAVTCIETSHYVSFVRHGPQPTDWLFFDSMADREGGENGFNVPQVRACPEVGRYLSLSEEELSRLDPASLKDTVRRLLCDSYMCLYHCPQISLYK